MKDKLIMINSINHKLPYGTILCVIREHINHKGWHATEAETNRMIYVPKNKCEEI